MRIITLFVVTIVFLSDILAQHIPLDKKDVPPHIEEIKITGTSQEFSNVEEITQTKDGHIWLATNQGLVKYDGTDFTVYNVTNTENIFRSFTCLSVIEDDEGTLWVGTRPGLITVKNNVFSRYNDSVFHEIQVTKMCKDDKGNIYVGTLQKGLFRINPDKSLYKYPEPLEDDIIFSLLYADTTLWIGTTTHGLIRLKDEKFEYLKNISPHFSYEFRDAYKDRNGNYWFGSDQNGLVKYSNNKV